MGSVPFTTKSEVRAVYRKPIRILNSLLYSAQSNLTSFYNDEESTQGRKEGIKRKRN